MAGNHDSFACTSDDLRGRTVWAGKVVDTRDSCLFVVADVYARMLTEG